jgi:asparagine synthase (glutamine-hydrolysing)
MCGIAGIVGNNWSMQELNRMVEIQHHRGPDSQGISIDTHGLAGLGHNRLSIIDLSADAQQPMSSGNGNLSLVFNGEIYNYLELRRELSDYPFHSRSDTEVILAAYERWGEACLDRFIGMFALAIWDRRERKLFAARDRFGVKPFYYASRPDGTLLFASEIKALHAAGVSKVADEKTWATYLTSGAYDHSEYTFWEGIKSLGAGHRLVWKNNRVAITEWYNLAERVGPDFDHRPAGVVKDEYSSLLKESVGLRFRSDVPVGINISGGLDSSILLGLIREVQGDAPEVKAFTFITGDPVYDELPWVRQTLSTTQHPLVVCRLMADEVPALAASVQEHQDEPFGGLPTLAYARLFERARAEGVIVLIDGQGMDEQWAGYDYYAQALSENGTAAPPLVQGISGRATRPECLDPEFAALARERREDSPFPDRLRNLQRRDACFTKIPRALRFNDRISMRSSTELREPFLHHRLFEIALRQPAERKIMNGISKLMLRQIAADLLPSGVAEAPKRPLQTPQREWLHGPLRDWAEDYIGTALKAFAESWLDSSAIKAAWRQYCTGNESNSFYIWQWISLGLLENMFDRLRSIADIPSRSAVSPV